MTSQRTLRAVDQVINSGSSALYSIGVVVVTDDSVLGAFAIATTMVPLMLGLARTSVHEALLVGVPASERHGLRWISAAAGATAALIGTVATLIVAFAVDIDVGPNAVLAVAVSSGMVLLFDGLRFAAFAADAARSAAIADGVWFAIAGLGVSVTAWHGDVDLAVLSWWYGAGAAVAALLFIPVLRRGANAPLPATVRHQFRFGSDFVLQIVPSQAALVLAVLVSSFAAVGQVRAAVTLFNPLATIVYAIRLTLLDRRDSRTAMATGFAYGTVSLLYTAVLATAVHLAPGAAERSIGSLAVPLILLVGIGEAGRHVTQAVIDGIRRAGALRDALTVRAFQALLLLVGSVLLGGAFGGTGLGGARAVAFAASLAVLTLPFAWLGRRRLQTEPTK